MKSLATILAAALIAVACAPTEPPIALGAPPTESERRTLGPDAYDDYFLASWRRCTKYASDDACWRQMYGGDGGIP